MSTADKVQDSDHGQGHALRDEGMVTAVDATIRVEGVEMTAIEGMIDTGGRIVTDEAIGLVTEHGQDHRMIEDQEDKSNRRVYSLVSSSNSAMYTCNFFFWFISNCGGGHLRFLSSRLKGIVLRVVRL